MTIGLRCYFLLSCIRHITTSIQRHQSYQACKTTTFFRDLVLLLDRLNELLGRLLAVSLWVVLRPPPEIRTRLLERELCIAGELLRVGGCFLESTADDPVLTVVALHATPINILRDAIDQQLTSCS